MFNLRNVRKLYKTAVCNRTIAAVIYIIGVDGPSIVLYYL